MKNFTISMMIIFCLGISVSFAQTNNSHITFKKTKQVNSITNVQNTNYIQSRSAVDCIFSDDFSDPSTWVIDHDASACNLDWEIGTGLECGGSYPIASIVSTTVDNGYAMVDSDEYGGEEGGSEVEDSWFTTANPMNLADYDNVVLQFETWYRSYNSERCFVVTSTTNTDWPELTPDSEADPANGIYEVFPGISGSGDALQDNPSLWRINISESAGGEEQVWVRFHWTGTWGYAWFIDDVCVMQQPANDMSLNYGFTSHTGTGEEYGRIPVNQVSDDMAFGGEVYNFGTSGQSEVNLSMDAYLDGNSLVSGENGFTMYTVDGDGYYSIEETDGMLDSDESGYFEMFMSSWAAGGEGLYSVDFVATSSEEEDGSEFFSDNIKTREFSVTEDLYSIDGIGVYADPAISSMGTNSFTDGSDGFMMMTMYVIDQQQKVAGLEILLDSHPEFGYSSPTSVAGGEVIISLRDTSDVMAETFEPSETLVESDFYMVTEYDVEAGVLQVTFDEPYTLSPGAYYACVEMYSNNNETDIRILDDETVPQPWTSSVIFIPGDQVYSNGTAAAIRMQMGDGEGFDIEESTLNSVSIYPNPSNGIIGVNFDENDNYTIEVMNVLGEIVLVENTKFDTTIDLTNFGKGTYLVKVSGSDSSKTERIVIK